MNRIFKRRLESLKTISQFVDQALDEFRVDPAFSFPANFVVEELFTNMVKYNHTSNDDITVSLEKNNRSLIITLIDYDVDPFDPRSTKDVDISKPLQERIVGGLGIYLVKKLAEKIDYDYSGRQSKITVTMSLENQNV